MMSWTAVSASIPNMRSSFTATAGVPPPSAASTVAGAEAVRISASSNSCCSSRQSQLSWNFFRFAASPSSDPPSVDGVGIGRGVQSLSTPNEKPRSPSMPMRASQ